MPRRRLGSFRSATRNPPITPMIDVMMCLLIVFMLIQPGLRHGLDLQMPADPSTSSGSAPGQDRIVLRVMPGPAYFLNDQAVVSQSLVPQLRGVFADRARKVLFVEGDSSSTYADVIHAVDLAREAGIEVVGLVPRPATGNGRASSATPAP